MIRRVLKAFIGYLRTPVAQSAEEFGDAIEEEIAFHVEARTREYIKNGMPEKDASRAALKRFGDTSQVAAECHAAAIGGLILWHRLHLTMTATLAVALGWLWFASAQTIEDQPELASPLPPGIASMLDNDWTGDVTGQILDEQGRPIEEAHVLVVVKTWPDQSYFQRAYAGVSDRHGKFVIQDVHPVNERYEVQIAAVAKGRALKSSYHSATAGTLEPVVLELPPSSGFAVQVESEQGVKLTDVEVLPHGRVEASGTEHFVYFDSAQSLVSRTDDDGRAELPYFQPGDTANFLLRASKGEWKSHDVKVPAVGEIVTIRISL